MKSKKAKQIFTEVIFDYTDEETGNIAIDAYPNTDPSSENGKTVAWACPDGKIVPGSNPEVRASDLECSLVKSAIVEAVAEQEVRKQKLVDDVIDELKEQFRNGDYTVLDELLKLIPTKSLIFALDEEKWGDYRIKIK